jgi:ankyrin repeat protein
MGSLASYQEETPLHLAARLGYIAGTSLLLEHGTDFSCIDEVGQTPLYAAARSGRLETMRLLLEKGADMNVKDASGWTPAHRAAWNKHAEAVELLEIEGADMGATSDGLTVEAFLANDEEAEGSDGWSST